MISRPHLRTFRPLFRPTVAGMAALAVFALVILSVTPNAHTWIHRDHEEDRACDAGDAQHPDHVCGVTLAQQGFYDSAPVVAGIAAPEANVEGQVVVPVHVRWNTPDHWLQPAQGPPAVHTRT